MTQTSYTQHIESALESTVGDAGASVEVFQQWREFLPRAWERLQASHPAEVAALMDSVTRTDDLEEIEALGTFIATHFKTLVVVGMGGSSLGAEVLASLGARHALSLHVLDTIGPRRFAGLMNKLTLAETAFLFVSKSGHTVELHALMGALVAALQQAGLPLSTHCYCITRRNGNPLHQWAQRESVRVLDHAADLCGRFSILSAVGALPAAALGLNVRALRAGAKSVIEQHAAAKGPAADGAALQMTLMDQGIAIYVLMYYLERLAPLVWWVRQCWAESLGKNGLGTISVPSRGPVDQHSQLQLYLDGPADKFFTALVLDTYEPGPEIGAVFPYLHGKRLGDLLMAEQRATQESLTEQGCPVRVLNMARLDEQAMGAVLMHFMLETLYTASLMEVNPFDQPAVEAGKKKALAYLATQPALA